MNRKMLDAEELCALSGLSREWLADLEAAGLLRPDRPGEYRGKQVTWARKLAYLLDAGWTLAEIKTWTRVRWSAPNPHQWPPDSVWIPQEREETPRARTNLPTRACDN